jgi:hypothetical protein
MKLMSDSLAKIAPAIVKAQSKMGNAIKDAKNPFFKSSYADLNSVREAVLPSFNENGISVLQPTVYVDGRKFVQTILIHESGEYFSGLTEVLAVKEADAQAQGSGISYARRYGLQSLANVGAEDDDGNSASGKTSVRAASAPVTKEIPVAKLDPALGKLIDETKTGTIPPASGELFAMLKVWLSYLRDAKT